MTEDELPAIRSALLTWFDANRRDLPWRYSAGETPDPYRVWLSEIMLQQTRVDTVRPYYQRWIERYPSLAALADADLEDVLKAWEGLGYYSRARNFHAAVREVVERYGGRVPDDPARFRALPGVGEYTAGAVMSIAFGQEEAAVDGNVRRVVARLRDDPEPALAMVRDAAARLARGERPGDLNQALMELGALVCTPRLPDCRVCPIRSACAAFKEGTQLQRPLPRQKAPVPVEDHGVAIVRRGEQLLMVKRPERGRLAGMWEFPGWRASEGVPPDRAAVWAARELAGVELSISGEAVATVIHIFSHVRVNYHVFIGEPTTSSACPDTPSVQWANPNRLSEIPLPRAQQKIARIIADYATAGR